MISVKEVYKLKELEEELIRRGWSEGKFDGRRCLIKEEENWIWIYFSLDQEVRFVSFPLEDSSKTHSKGVERLKEEIREIFGILELPLTGRLELG